jgi:PAS domain S-box-containing protein
VTNEVRTPRPDAATVARAVGGLPLAVVLLDGDGRPVWTNPVADGVAGLSEAGRARLLAAVTEAVDRGERVARLPGDRGILDRELWVASLDGGDRLVAFHPDAPPPAAVAAPDAVEHVHRLEAMLEHTHDLVTVLAADGTVLVSNAAAGRLSGFSGGSVNGADAFSFIHPDDRDAVAVAFADVLGAPGVHPTIEVRLRFADEEWHDIEATPCNLLDVAGVEGIVVSMHDVTDRRRAEADADRSNAYLQSLVENLSDVIVVLDAGFEVKWTSPALSRIIDAPVETNLGQSAFNDMHPDDLGGAVEALTWVASQPLGTQTRVELRLESRPGSDRWRWIEAIAVNRLEDPHVAGLVCTLRDVTESKAAADELQAAFERERRAAERLRELDVLKDQFLASVSHEMRTPLAIIIGFADLLSQASRLTDDVREEAVGRIRSAATEMRGMVENLLDYSELEAGKLTMRVRPVPLRAAVEATATALRTVLGDHPLRVEVPDDLVASADGDGVDRILRNLLTNAAKYSERERPITITGRRDGDDVLLEVADEGVGIPEDQLGLVFERLYRAPGAAFAARGTGVGLNMVRRYAELMGGSIAVRSAVGEGSTFTVRLPVG